MTRPARGAATGSARPVPTGSARPVPAGSARPVLLAVAHGSRDPAGQRCIGAITRRVSNLDPVIDVRFAFLQNAQPAIGMAVTQAAADAGPRGVTIVPLLLAGAGYHLSQDIAGAAAGAGVPTAAPLGPDPALTRALADRLAEAGVPAGTPVVLAAAGSRDPRAAADARRQAALLAGQLRVPTVAAYVCAARPTVAEAVAELAAAAGRPAAVASYLLAPGWFQQELGRSGAGWVSAPLGDHPGVARLVLERFRACRAARPA
jgi:sirohydrochlorin ferrochelatase